MGRKFKLGSLLLSVALIAGVLLSGCAKTPATAKKLTVVLIPKCAVPFFDDCNTGGKEEAAALGVNYEWIAPTDTQGATQVKIIEDLIAKHVDGIAMSCNEPVSVEAVIKKAIAAGIKVITFDSDSPNSGRLMYIGTSNQAAGSAMATEMATRLNGKGKVAIVTGQLGADNLNQRIAGIKATLSSKYPGITVVDLQGTDDDMNKGVTVTENLLRAHPDLNGIFGVSQVGGPAAVKVLGEQEFSKFSGKIQVSAFDDLADTIAGVKAGTINFMMVQRPVTMGKLSVENLVKLIKGEETKPADIDTGCTVVTKDNITAYTK